MCGARAVYVKERLSRILKSPVVGMCFSVDFDRFSCIRVSLTEHSVLRV